jgi:hypothetical protein
VVHAVGQRERRPAAAALNPAYWPHSQSTQVQFAQVHFGLPQLRAALPQSQSTQVHGSQVHAGFSQVVAVLMIGSYDDQQRLARSPSVPSSFLI